MFLRRSHGLFGGFVWGLGQDESMGFFVEKGPLNGPCSKRSSNTPAVEVIVGLVEDDEVPRILESFPFDAPRFPEPAYSNLHHVATKLCITTGTSVFMCVHLWVSLLEPGLGMTKFEA